MKFGISTWNFLKAYGEKADLYTAVEKVRIAHFGLELWLDWNIAPELIPDQVGERKRWDHLQRICRNNVGLSLHSRLISFFDIQILKEEIELCRFLEGDILVVHPRSLGLEMETLEYSVSVEPSESDIDRVVEIVGYAEEKGVCLALENGPFSVLKRVRDRIRAEGLGRNFGICLDTGHANLHRNQHPSLLEDFFEEFNDDLLHIHISDNRGEVDEHISPGEGTIDWSVVVPRLVNLKLKGQLLFELNTPEPIGSANNAINFLLNQPQRTQRPQREERI
jgi:sugar phosphate isomerase/epimerase